MSIVKFIASRVEEKSFLMSGIARFPLPSSAAVLLAVPLIFSAVLGFGVLIQPDSIGEGSPISITFSNITDGYILNTTIVSTFPAASSTSWYNITNWGYSFGLQNGNVTVIGTNVNRIMLLARAGSGLRRAEDTGTGNIVVRLPLDIQQGMYYDYRILYEVHNSTVPVQITLIQQGAKEGLDDSVSTPAVYGISSGSLEVEILANGTFEGSQVIRVASPAPTPATTPQATTGPQPPTPPTVSGTALATTLPATPNSVEKTPSASPTPPATPGPEGLSPWIIGYAAVVVLIAALADYFILRD
jgi:hypothetical protein